MNTPVEMLVPGSMQQMDTEHRVQMNLLNAFEEATQNDQDRDVARSLLEQFATYTDAHFMSEQLLMRLYAYPDYDGHQSEHDQMMDSLGALRGAWVDGRTPAALAQLKILRDMMAEHIQKRDTAFHAFMDRLAKRPA